MSTNGFLSENKLKGKKKPLNVVGMFASQFQLNPCWCGPAVGNALKMQHSIKLSMFTCVNTFKLGLNPLSIYDILHFIQISD